mmetsp:Transcript_43855/g.42365  ORF Transcript_43855/g.42365 Transcript_43855/m.42365 type:complete len:395 (+) Transcript_43855:1126-2310(+)
MIQELLHLPLQPHIDPLSHVGAVLALGVLLDDFNQTLHILYEDVIPSDDHLLLLLPLLTHYFMRRGVQNFSLPTDHSAPFVLLDLDEAGVLPLLDLLILQALVHLGLVEGFFALGGFLEVQGRGPTLVRDLVASPILPMHLQHPTLIVDVGLLDGVLVAFVGVVEAVLLEGQVLHAADLLDRRLHLRGPRRGQVALIKEEVPVDPFLMTSQRDCQVQVTQLTLGVQIPIQQLVVVSRLLKELIIIVGVGGRVDSGEVPAFGLGEVAVPEELLQGLSDDFLVLGTDLGHPLNIDGFHADEGGDLFGWVRSFLLGDDFLLGGQGHALAVELGGDDPRLLLLLFSSSYEGGRLLGDWLAESFLTTGVPTEAGEVQRVHEHVGLQLEVQGRVESQGRG